MYKTVPIHEMQQYGHRGHYKVDTFLIKIYTFRNIIRIQTSSRNDLFDPKDHVPFTYMDASSVGRCYMTKHAGVYRLLYEFYFSFVHMLVCKFGC